MTAKYSLSTCPSLVYHTIVKYLAPRVIIARNYRSYIDLQQCCNLAFAHEVRSVMKTSLQSIQAAQAYDDLHYLASFPGLRYNPIYLASLTFEDLSTLFIQFELCGATFRSNTAVAFTKLFVTFTKRRSTIQVPDPVVRYPIKTSSHIVRTEQLFIAAHNLYGFDVEAHWNVETCVSDIVSKYDFALIKTNLNSGVKTALIGDGNGEHLFIYSRERESQETPYLCDNEADSIW